MTDHRLLELAAKVAGIEQDGAYFWNANGDAWNPLEDDGDALRLAVRLHMSVLSNETMSWVATGMHQIVRAEEPHDGTDPYAATRRAIVRAAAEIAQIHIKALEQPKPQPTYPFTNACKVCGLTSTGHSIGYVCSRTDCPTAVRCTNQSFYL